MNHRQANTYSLVLIGILCLFTVQSFCQEYNTNISNISVKNGLSQNTIQDILQDDDGFLWIGTQDGLNKYDGYTFKVYKSDPQNSNSIPNNFIKCIAKDKQGNLWIGTQTGLSKYVYKTDRFQNVPTTIFKEINNIFIDDEKIIIGTEKGLLKASSLTNAEFKLIESTISENPIKSLSLDKNGKIWIGKDTGLYMLSPGSNKLYNFEFLNSTPVRSLILINQKIWIGSDKGLFSFDPDSVNVNSDKTASISGLTKYRMPNMDYHAISVFKDHRNSIWVGTETKGIFEVDEKRSALVESNFKSELFKYSSINKIYEDYTHCLWVGTVEAGLYRINISNKNFRLIRTETSDANGLTSNIVRGLLKIDHRLWIGTSRGLNLFNRKTAKNQKFVYNENDSESISSNDVKIMDYSTDGAVWVGTNVGLNRLDPKTGTFERYFAEDDNPIISNNKIRAVKSMKNGSIWIGTLGGGISVINSANRKHIRSYNTKNGGIGDDNVMNIFETKSKEIYAATYGDGLYRLNKRVDVFEKVLPDSNLPHLLTSIHQSDDDILWIGTYGDGFYQFDSKTNQYQQFTTENGLSNDVVYAAVPDGNDVWISTNYGLNKYDRNVNTFLSFNENDGIQSNEFNTNSFFQCYTGELFFGGVNGLTYFFPDSIKYNSKKPRLAFTDLKIFNETVRPGQILIDGKPPLMERVSDSSQVTLAHFHNSFSIEFASLDYSNPEDSKYAYQLVGFDEDWIFTDADKRNVTYTNLNPGEYTFMMKASNGDGKWNEQASSLFITIEPSIWQTLWFRIFGLLVGSSIVALLVYRRINKVERRKKYLETKIKEHTKEISQQNKLLTQSEQYLINENKKKDQVFYILSHNVRSPLTTLVALLKNSDELPKSDFERFISDSSQRVTESLLSLDNAFYWSLIQFDKLMIYEETFDVSSLIDENIKKFNKTFKLHDVSILFTPSNHQVATDRRMLSLIIQNQLFNSIKFSKPDSQIKVALVRDQTALQMTITYHGEVLDKKDINELFNNVTEIHEIKSQNEKGVALGLIVSYKLAKHLKFNLLLEKRLENSTLTLEMPL
ncbi:two-component regulator propeller domain-containing protein [Ekhidna sp.]|uniref:ligand-binding sensor domain-containing protein n=1 Tax=Ekhidna sp. TaxID=2608089 RepID=UPI003299E875